MARRRPTAWSGLIVIASLLTIRPAAMRQSTAPSPAGLIVGQAINASTGKPVGGAAVTLSKVASPNLPAPAGPAAAGQGGAARLLTDREGHFVFRDLPAGAYTLTASKSGYVNASFGQRVAGGGSQTIQLGQDERRGACDIRLWKDGALNGTVRDEAGEPLPGIQVRVARRAIVAGTPLFAFVPNPQTTDDRGIYRFSSLTPGDYIVSVVRTATTVPASVIEAASAGDQAGPLSDFSREAARSSPFASIGNNLSMVSGQRVGDLLLSTSLSPLDPTSATLPVSGDKIFVYPTTYYASTPSAAEATLVSVGAGEEHAGTDFQLQPTGAVRVSGRLTGPNGPESFTTLSLLPESASRWQRDYDIAAAETTTDSTGAFTFLGVPSGDYLLRVLKIPARPIISAASSATTVIQTGTGTTFMGGGGPPEPARIPDEPTLWAEQPVDVNDRDITDLSVALRTGARVKGHVEFAGSAAPPVADRLRSLMLQFPLANGRDTSLNLAVTLSRGVVTSDGLFSTYQLPPGRYAIRVGALPGWNFAGAFLKGADVTDGLEVGAEDVANLLLTFTDKSTELSGSVSNGRVPDVGASVIVFPASPDAWTGGGPQPRRLRAARVGSDGLYHLSGLAAGEYLVAALTSERPDWQDAKFLATVAPKATRVSLSLGDNKSQDLVSLEIK